jgi:LysM repeat protein
MSAMRVEELPEFPVPPEPPAAPPEPPAAPPEALVGLPRDSARTRAAVRWTAPVDPLVPGLDRLLDTPGEQPRPGHDSLYKQSASATHPRTARPRTANPPLRLTRRGRVVIAIAAALVLAALSLVIATAAQATSHPVPPGAGQQGVARVTVRPGQSLWSVAENADPDADTRVVIQQIIELNGLNADTVYAGQRLWVPRG